MRGRAAAAIACLLAASCSAPGSSPGELVVLAAASLSEPLRAAGAAFEKMEPEARVLLSFGASDGLAAQIAAGAPTGVFASASPRWMDAVAEDPGVGGRRELARGRLVVVVPRSNPAGIRRFADVARPGVSLVVAARGVPAGDYAREALRLAGIAEAARRNVVSDEESVKAALQKVILGEADAGIVYATDVAGAARRRVRVVEIPERAQVRAVWEIAVVAGAGNPGLAERFVSFVLASGIMRAHGFEEPA